MKLEFNKEENIMHETEVKGILSAQNGINIYRGCTHGCIYCDSRSRCYQMHHDFEDIEVKANAPKVLEERYNYAYQISSPNNDRLMDMVKKTCKSHGILCDIRECFNYLHKFEENNVHEQLMLPGLDQLGLH